jgi:NADP-dependent 3-hydroxy acid dehydrogenase YdfG
MAAKKQAFPPQQQKRQPGREHLMHPEPDYAPRYPGSGRLNGKVALVTGGDSGIGRAVSVLFAREGAGVAIVYKEEERDARDTESLIGAETGKALLIRGDVGEKAFCEDAVRRTVERFGRLDIVVNNAGLMLLGPILGADTREWTRMVELNVLGLMYVTAAALPHLLRAAEEDPRLVSDLVNVSSVAGRVARAGSGAYNATKWAVNAFSEALRQEVTERHVRVTLVEPGAVSTELAGHNRPEVLAALRSSLGDIERMESEDIADAITYVVTRPRHVALNEVLIRPTEQVR